MNLGRIMFRRGYSSQQTGTDPHHPASSHSGAGDQATPTSPLDQSDKSKRSFDSTDVSSDHLNHSSESTVKQRDLIDTPNQPAQKRSLFGMFTSPLQYWSSISPPSNNTSVNSSTTSPVGTQPDNQSSNTGAEDQATPTSALDQSDKSKRSFDSTNVSFDHLNHSSKSTIEQQSSNTTLPTPPGPEQKLPEESNSTKNESSWKKVAIGAAVGTAVGVGTIAAAPIVLPAIGFSTTGVVAGTLAAAAQSTIGNVAAGSLFATLQSIGAVGGLSWTAAGTATAASVAAGTATGATAELVARKMNASKRDHTFESSNLDTAASVDSDQSGKIKPEAHLATVEDKQPKTELKNKL